MDVTGLIIQSQCGGPEGKVAANELIFHIAEKYRDRKLSKFFHRGVSYADRDELRQVFLIGCYNGIMEAKLDIGDPLAFILNKGLWAVADEIRRIGSKELQQECSNCATMGRPNRVRGQYVCRQCGSDETKLQLKVIPHTQTIEAAGYHQDDRLTVREFREQIDGRKRDVFDLMMQGYDRGSCKNFLKEIGQVLGVSTTNVSIRVKQIRQAWVRYQALG